MSSNQGPRSRLSGSAGSHFRDPAEREAPAVYLIRALTAQISNWNAPISMAGAQIPPMCNTFAKSSLSLPHGRNETSQRTGERRPPPRPLCLHPRHRRGHHLRGPSGPGRHQPAEPSPLRRRRRQREPRNHDPEKGGRTVARRGPAREPFDTLWA